MTTLMEERMRRYTQNQIGNILKQEGITPDDMTFLTAISNYAIVVEVPGQDEGKLAGLKATDVPVFEVSGYPSGIWQEDGKQPIILLNTDTSIMDYDFVSELHPQHDWDVYLWMDVPWVSAKESFGIMGEWYRRDTYPDGFKPFDGQSLGWEDLPPNEEEK